MDMDVSLSPLEKLPSELLVMIASKLSMLELIFLEQASKRMKSIVLLTFESMEHLDGQGLSPDDGDYVQLASKILEKVLFQRCSEKLADYDFGSEINEELVKNASLLKLRFPKLVQIPNCTYDGFLEFAVRTPGITCLREVTVSDSNPKKEDFVKLLAACPDLQEMTFINQAVHLMEQLISSVEDGKFTKRLSLIVSLERPDDLSNAVVDKLIQLTKLIKEFELSLLIDSFESFYFFFGEDDAARFKKLLDSGVKIDEMSLSVQNESLRHIIPVVKDHLTDLQMSEFPDKEELLYIGEHLTALESLQADFSSGTLRRLIDNFPPKLDTLQLVCDCHHEDNEEDVKHKKLYTLLNILIEKRGSRLGELNIVCPEILDYQTPKSLKKLFPQLLSNISSKCAVLTTLGLLAMPPDHYYKPDVKRDMIEYYADMIEAVLEAVPWLETLDISAPHSLHDKLDKIKRELRLTKMTISEKKEF